MLKQLWKNQLCCLPGRSKDTNILVWLGSTFYPLIELSSPLDLYFFSGCNPHLVSLAALIHSFQCVGDISFNIEH
jgi:hypothetical protein